MLCVYLLCMSLRPFDLSGAGLFKDNAKENQIVNTEKNYTRRYALSTEQLPRSTVYGSSEACVPSLPPVRCRSQLLYCAFRIARQGGNVIREIAQTTIRDTQATIQGRPKELGRATVRVQWKRLRSRRCTIHKRATLSTPPKHTHGLRTLKHEEANTAASNRSHKTEPTIYSHRMREPS